MKLLVVLAVLLISACSDSDNGIAPGTTSSDPDTTTPTSGQNGLPVPLQSQLETLFEVSNGDVLQEMSAILLLLVAPVDSGFEFVSSRTDESDLTTRDLYSCTEGGTVEVWKSSAVANEPRTNATAAECAFGPRVVTGEFYITDPINLSDVDYLLVSEVQNYTVTDNVDESTTTLETGTVRYNSNDPSGTPRNAVSWGGEFLTVSRLAGSYSINSTEYLTRVNDTAATLPDGSEGRTTKVNALIDLSNELRQVRTTQPFQPTDGSGDFTSGVLLLSGNNSSIELDANSGAESTFILTETANAVTTSYEVQWSDRFRFRILDPKNTDLAM